MQRRTQPPKASTTLHYGRCACGHALNRRGERAPDLAREWEDKTAAPLPRSDAAITYQALPAVPDRQPGHLPNEQQRHDLLD